MIFEQIKNEAGFMKELVGHLELQGGAELDVSAQAGELKGELKVSGTFFLCSMRSLRELIT